VHRLKFWLIALASGLVSGGVLAESTALARVAVTIPSLSVQQAPMLAEEAKHDDPELRSRAFMVVDQLSGRVLLSRKANEVTPIASLTKLMTAMVVLDRQQSLKDIISIDDQDVDTLRHSRSRLSVGTRLTREEALRLALMSSENRAASALARHYPGGNRAFVKAMNAKARLLGLGNTYFAESTGLSAGNVSTARDLARMVLAASRYPLIREFSTGTEYTVDVANGSSREFRNTNGLVRDPDWQIGLSKTGYIKEAGRCLVMQAWLKGRPLLVVLLDSTGKYTRTADARRLRKWLAERPWDRSLARADHIKG